MTATTWNSINKDIVLRYDELIHSGNGAQTVTSIVTTTITATDQMTFDDLADELSSYGITLTINNGVIQLNSDAVAARDNRIFYIDKNCAIPTYFGFTQDTMNQTWTYGTDTTGAASSFIAKMTDYISDTYKLSEWNAVNKTLTIKHTYLDHDSHTTVIEDTTTIEVNDQMTFEQLHDLLDDYGIILDINSSGVVTMDSNTLGSGASRSAYYVTGAIADHFGIKKCHRYGYTEVTVQVHPQASLQR